MQFIRIVILLILGSVANTCAAQVEFRLAFRKNESMSIPMTFQNDPSFKFMSAAPLIGAHDLKKATAVLQQGRAALSIEISESARRKINALAAKNRISQDRGAFDDQVGLAVLVDGQPRSVIQGVFQELSAREFWWSPSDGRLPPKEQMKEAEALAGRINDQRP